MSTFSRLAFSLRQPTFDLSLYLVANRPSFQDEHLFFTKIQKAVKGGVSCVQLRDHTSDFSTTLKTARQLKNILGNTPLFINTLKACEMAQAVCADGVYLEERVSYAEARKLLGKKAMIGIPVKTMEDVNAARFEPHIDYLSVKIAPSKKTCPRNDAIWGIEGLRTIRALLPSRIVAIGGLHLECVETVYRELRIDDGIAMAGGLMAEDDPYQTAQKIQSVCQKIRGKW